MKSKLLGVCLAGAVTLGGMVGTSEGAILRQRIGRLIQGNLSLAGVLLRSAPQLPRLSQQQQLELASDILTLELSLIGGSPSPESL